MNERKPICPDCGKSVETARPPYTPGFTWWHRDCARRRYNEEAAEDLAVSQAEAVHTDY